MVSGGVVLAAVEVGGVVAAEAGVGATSTADEEGAEAVVGAVTSAAAGALTAGFCSSLG